MRLAVAEDRADNIIAQIQFPTTVPKDDLPKMLKWLQEHKPFEGLGIASFGPIDPKVGSKTYGFITGTPKVAWRNTDIVGPMRALGVPVIFDTDVNAPALNEYMMARDRGEKIDNIAYITVGTGIGVGVVVNGQPVHGLMHPEGGHIPTPPPPGQTMNFARKADTSGGKLEHKLPDGPEANASAPALAARKGLKHWNELKDLADDDPVWDVAAHYFAQVCVALVLLVSPERIVLSGGVMKRACLYQKTQALVRKTLNGYIGAPELNDRIDSYIVPASKEPAGLLGALALGRSAAQQKKSKL